MTHNNASCRSKCKKICLYFVVSTLMKPYMDWPTEPNADLNIWV